MIAMTGDRGAAQMEAGNNVARMPSMANASKDQMAVAATILGAVGVLYLLRRGMKGIGNIELTASTVGGVEWLCYYIIVNGAIRVVQIKFPDSRFSKAMFFLS